MENTLKEAISDLNPWWLTLEPPPEHSRPRRSYCANFEELVLKGRTGRVMVLAGMRRTGKTHMMVQLAGAAIATNAYKPAQVVFISGSDPRFQPSTILNLTQEISELFEPDENWLLLIDEVQFFEDWKRELTYIADHMPRVKCAVSTSADSVLNLLKKQTETGLGRLLELYVPPLLFCEYLQFVGAWPAHLPEADSQAILTTRLDAAAIDKLNKEFINYINFGAFPQLAYAYRENLPSSTFDDLAREMRSSPAVHYLGDSELLTLLGARDGALLRALGNYIIRNLTSVYSQKHCVRELGIHQQTLIKYLYFLEGTYFMRTLRKIDVARRAKKYRHTHCKFILENCSLPSLVHKPVKAASDELRRRVTATVLAQFANGSIMEQWGYVGGWRSAGEKIEIDFCHLDFHRQLLMLAQIEWTDEYAHHKQAASAIAYIRKRWRQSTEVPPGLYCTSKTCYGAGTDLIPDLRILPAAQFSIALGVKRIQESI